MLAQIVFIQQCLLHVSYCWLKLMGKQVHISNLFQHYRVMHGTGRIATPGKRAMTINQNRRNFPALNA